MSGHLIPSGWQNADCLTRLHVMQIRTPRIYTISPGLSFADALARTLLTRYRDNPLELSRTRILLPNRRSQRTLHDAFLRAGDGQPLLLPRMMAVGDIDEDTLDVSADAHDALSLPPAISASERLFLLTRLSLAVPAKSGGPASLAAALRLSRELARLIDSVHTERLDFTRLPDLVPETLAQHWQHVLKFLKIITHEWPRVLESMDRIDPADRRNRLLADLARRWRTTPPDGPVIAAGTTGSVPATADLLSVVARLPQGHVILPGLDLDLSPEDRKSLDPVHPQYQMARLLEHMGVAWDEVRPWPLDTEDKDTESRRQPRIRLIQTALLPAERVGFWARYKKQLDKDHKAAFKGLRHMDFPGLREEAGVIALLMREALETPGKRVALVTPDRQLARLVQAELRRWDIDVDDSAGQPLSESLPGTWLRLVAHAALELTPLSLLSLMKHPLAAAGKTPSDIRRLARRLDKFRGENGYALRGPRPEPGIQALCKAVCDAGVGMDADKLSAFLLLLEPLEQALKDEAVSFEAVLDLHLGAAEALAQTSEESGAERLWSQDAGRALARILTDMRSMTHSLPAYPGAQYPAFFDALLEGEVVRPLHGQHPRLAILGTIEARLYHADLMILGGMNEGVWPASPAHDPWMSRAMRVNFGLPDHQRRTGQAAHDLVQACGAPEVIMTRSEKVDGTPTVPSRWLSRLQALAPPVSRGGDTYLRLYRTLDHADKATPVTAPRPTPPVSARPKTLSVTQIETWIRDPYALYARHILELSPLDPLEADPDAPTRGTRIHDALDSFFKNRGTTVMDDEQALALLEDCGRRAFGPLLNRPTVWAFWWPRFQAVAKAFIALQKERDKTHKTLATEVSGKLEIASHIPFTLKAQADRIDWRYDDGTLEIIDYKTGTPPSGRQVAAGFAPQMPLQGWMVKEGAFAGIDKARINALSFWYLKGTNPTAIKPQSIKDHEAAIAAARLGLVRLLEHFSHETTPYLSTPRPAHKRYGDYDHLARVAEWTQLPDPDDDLPDPDDIPLPEHSRDMES